MSAAGEIPRIPTPAAIRDATREVLDRPEFGAPSSWNEMLISLLNAIGEWLKSLASWAAQNPDLARILAIVLVLVSLALLVHILYLALGDLLPFGRRKAAIATRLSQWEILEGAARNWREALEIARRMLDEGNTRRAIWIAHRVMLGLLDERGRIRFAGWKTNSHYLRECAKDAPGYATFAELTEVYEQAVYAHRVTAPSAVESLVRRVDQFSYERA
ncbi:MAG: DUF4129 domain-containing protein [Candidatus Binatia bacterium]